MNSQAWNVLGYVFLMLSFLALVAMMGLPQLQYDTAEKAEVIRLLRDVAVAAAGYVFGRGLQPRKAGDP